jgi:acyl dehydratase
VDVDRDVHAGDAMTDRTRELTLTADRLRQYSRRGNFHADPDAARELGLPDLVAQGMQVAGPAYGLLLDEWGEDWLAEGVLELTFVGMVTADETVVATVAVDGDAATVTVTGRDDGRARVVGRAARRSGPGV